MDLTYMSAMQKLTIARTFAADFPSKKLTREEFDIYIIDKGFATDPGTDDTASIEVKGFNQERARAKKRLNTWAASLPPEEAYKILSVSMGTELHLVEWHEAAKGDISNVANRAKAVAQSRTTHLAQIKRQCEDMMLLATTEDAAATSAAMKEIVNHMKGHGLIFERTVLAAVEQYNRSYELMNEKAGEVLNRIDHQDNDDAGSNVA